MAQGLAHRAQRPERVRHGVQRQQEHGHAQLRHPLHGTLVARPWLHQDEVRLEGNDGLHGRVHEAAHPGQRRHGLVLIEAGDAHERAPRPHGEHHLREGRRERHHAPHRGCPLRSQEAGPGRRVGGIHRAGEGQHGQHEQRAPGCPHGHLLRQGDDISHQGEAIARTGKNGRVGTGAAPLDELVSHGLDDEDAAGVVVAQVDAVAHHGEAARGGQRTVRGPRRTRERVGRGHLVPRIEQHQPCLVHGHEVVVDVIQGLAATAHEQLFAHGRQPPRVQAPFPQRHEGHLACLGVHLGQTAGPPSAVRLRVQVVERGVEVALVDHDARGRGGGGAAGEGRRGKHHGARIEHGGERVRHAHPRHLAARRDIPAQVAIQRHPEIRAELRHREGIGVGPEVHAGHRLQPQAVGKARPLPGRCRGLGPAPQHQQRVAGGVDDVDIGLVDEQLVGRVARLGGLGQRAVVRQPGLPHPLRGVEHQQHVLHARHRLGALADGGIGPLEVRARLEAHHLAAVEAGGDDIIGAHARAAALHPATRGVATAAVVGIRLEIDTPISAACGGRQGAGRLALARLTHLALGTGHPTAPTVLRVGGGEDTLPATRGGPGSTLAGRCGAHARASTRDAAGATVARLTGEVHALRAAQREPVATLHPLLRAARQHQRECCHRHQKPRTGPSPLHPFKAVHGVFVLAPFEEAREGPPNDAATVTAAERPGRG
ncbi:hypothetical protein STIAU_5516 [Stigmatella aurantiaca DW4/3-1]|uniref:Uncharacterized protein n=1 Tax=Stigmatella aurantiaca (strain DW4/3-1) TaxID=378806 RepID=Q09E09_STIAD|nr:hypothetical protein STIAU_5516 [Stigmatella aurantiaca DW4/3-1]